MKQEVLWAIEKEKKKTLRGMGQIVEYKRMNEKALTGTDDVGSFSKDIFAVRDEEGDTAGAAMAIRLSEGNNGILTGHLRC